VPRTSSPTAVAIYARISSDPGETRLGVARQEQDCRALAERKGWPVVHVYVDNDISAATGKARPGYTALLKAVEFGAVDAVIAWDLDRLHRRPIELEEFFAVCDKAGVRHLATVGGDVDLSTGDGMLVARIKGAVAAEEIAKIRRRAKRKKLELAERGLPSGGGRRPFGFADDGMTHVPDEADAIRAMAARVIAGEPVHAIVRDLNAEGPSTVCGGIWRTNLVRQILKAPRTAGLRQHEGSRVGANPRQGNMGARATHPDRPQPPGEQGRPLVPAQRRHLVLWEVWGEARRQAQPQQRTVISLLHG